MTVRQVFLSAVTSEFDTYRNSLATTLRRPSLAIGVQEQFVATGTETLDLLDDWIRACDAVVHFVGDMTGAPVLSPSARLLLDRYSEALDRLPLLKSALLPGGQGISYTQAEAWLAVVHAKPLFIAIPNPGAVRGSRYRFDAAESACQARHLESLMSVERFPCMRFSSPFDLQEAIQKTTITDLIRHADANDQFVVERLMSVRKHPAELNAAVGLINRNIADERERYESDEFEDLIHDHLEGRYGPHRPATDWRTYFLVAKHGGQVVGTMLCYEDIRANFLFLPFLAVSQAPEPESDSDPDRQIAQRDDLSYRLVQGLLDERGRQNDAGRELRVVAEVDDPTDADCGTDERSRRLARICLFGRIAGAFGIRLRMLDMRYRQPSLDPGHLDLETDGRNMALLFGTATTPVQLDRTEVGDILAWLYGGPYSEDVYTSPDEKLAYGRYLQALLSAATSRLPQEIPLLNARQVRERVRQLR